MNLFELLFVIVIMGILAVAHHSAFVNRSNDDLVPKMTLMKDITNGAALEVDYYNSHGTFFASSNDVSCGAGLCKRDSKGYMYASGLSSTGVNTVAVPLSHDNIQAYFTTSSCSDGTPGFQIKMSGIGKACYEFDSCRNTSTPYPCGS